MIPHVRRVLILGGGSSGFLAAITLKQLLPSLDVEMLRSPEIGIIGVGEATTPLIPAFLHGILNLDIHEFYRLARPSWKLGIRFLWGPRDEFHYTFQFQTDLKNRRMARPMGYYCKDHFDHLSSASALMSAGRAFQRRPDGYPQIERDAAYHLENELLVAYLEGIARAIGVVIKEDTVKDVVLAERGVDRLVLASGGTTTADLFVDCSGFRALLMNALKEPFLSYRKSLFSDRAVVGGWFRGPDEPVMPYTTAETMPAGWAWKIEHENRIHRGYVYSSDFISDDDAIRDYRALCPKAEGARIVKFVSGRYRDCWVKNVVGVGNASGFVEPLESTSLSAIVNESEAIAAVLRDSDRKVTPSTIGQFNKRSARNWDAIRDFLAIHYRFNRRLDTPFWRACLADVDLAGGAPIVQYYQENGPSTLWRATLIDDTDQFRFEGYWTMLVGQKVPYETNYQVREDEWATFHQFREANRRQAMDSLTCEEAFAAIRRPEWRWDNAFYRGQPSMPLSNA